MRRRILDEDADTLAVTVLPKERQITLPVGGNVYPDSTYSVARAI